MRLTFGLVLAVAIAAATSAVAGDACKLLKQGTNTFCGTFVYSNGSPTDRYTVVFGPQKQFSINAGGDMGSGTFSCPGRSFIEVNYSFPNGETETWYGKAPAGAVNGTGFAQGVNIAGSYLYTWTLTRGACH